VFDTHYAIPEDCLTDDETEVFNLWVAINPARGGDGEVHEDDVNTQFFNRFYEDSDGEDRNMLCLDRDGTPGCIYDLTLSASPGHNLEINAVEMDSSVMTFSSDHCTIEDPSDAHLPLELELKLFGSDAHDGINTDHDYHDPMTELLGATGSVEVKFAMCPRGDGGDCLDTQYPLFISATDDEGVELIDDSHATVNMIPHQPSRTTLDLYVGQDSELCDALSGDDDFFAETGHDWGGYASFNLVTCAMVPFDEAGHGDHETNCRTDIVRVVHTTPSTSTTSSFELGETFTRNVGNSVVGVGAAFETYNLLNLGGAYSTTTADVSITGWLSLPIANAMVEGRAWVAVVGSGVAGNLDVFGARLWDYDATIPEVDYSDDITFSDSYCGSYTYGVAGIGLVSSLCLDGSAGITNALSVTAAEGESELFADSTTYGLIEASVTPEVAMGLTATASVDLAAVVGGINGVLNIVTTSLPATADLAWGLVELPSGAATVATEYSAGLELQNTLLSGSVSVFVNALQPAWCYGSWGIPYPCPAWARVVSQPLVSFAGYTYNYTLLSTSGSLVLEP
jgi:hypothetical protein